MKETNTTKAKQTAVPAGQSEPPCSVAAQRVERIGDCTLYLGDCAVILPQLPDFDLILTRPTIWNKYYKVKPFIYITRAWW